MGFIPAVWIVEAAVQYTLAGQEVRNILHIDPHESPSTSLLEAVGGVVALGIETYLMPHLSEDLSLYNVHTKDLTDVDGAVADAVYNTPVLGGEAQASLPNNVALCASFKTLLTGRSYQGRMYIPGLGINRVTDSQVAGATATTFLDALIDIVADINAAGWDLVVTSYINGGVPRASAVSTIVTDILVNVVTDSMRRRLPGRGS